MTIPVPTSELVGTFLEVLGYGVYLVVFPQCIRTLRRKHLGKGLKAYLLITMAITFLLITLHLFVDLIRTFVGFTSNMDVAGAPEAYFANVNTSLNLCKNSSLVSATLVSDALIIYRTLIVWGRNYWILILPVLFFCVDIGMSVWFTWSVHEAKRGNSVLISSTFARSKYFFAATLGVNLLCTLLIAYKIWKIQNAVKGLAAHQHRGSKALSIVIESAAIYSAALLCLIGTASANNSAMFWFLNSMPPLIGSVFSFVVLRSSMDNKRFNTTMTGTGSISAGGIKSTRNHHSSLGVQQGSSTSEGVHVHLERIVRHEGGSYVDDDSRDKFDKSFV